MQSNPSKSGAEAQVESPAASDGYWRSMGELEGSAEFQQFLDREFPVAASEFPEGVSRRRWLQLMSASIALSGAAGCRYGPVELAPFVIRPENTVAGVPKRYATNFELAGRAVHLLVTNRDGRPIKVEGNPDHPVMKASEPNDLSDGNQRFASAGTDVFSQACVLGLYDPDRLDRIVRRRDGEATTGAWDDFVAYASQHWKELMEGGGKSLAILMAPSLSPSVNRLVAEVVRQLPQARVAQYASVDDESQREACAKAAGQPAELLYDLSAAKVICCLDCDLLGNDPNMVLYSRQFSKGRAAAGPGMNRLYAAESRYSVTGATADTRVPVRSSHMGALLVRIEQRVDELLAGGAAPAGAGDEPAFDQISPAQQVERFIEAVAEDLVANQGASLVSVGSHLPVDVQTTALRLNQKLGNIGHTVQLMPSRSAIPGVDPIGLGQLVEAIDGGQVDTVWILGDNPVYAAPGDVKLGEALQRLEHVVYCAEFDDETAAHCAWSIPLAHPLESWGDVLGVDGSYGVCQPQILPLLGGKTVPEVLTALMANPVSGEEVVRATANGIQGALPSRVWRETLHNGFLAGASRSPISGELQIGDEKPVGTLDVESLENGQLELVFVPSDAVYDGRFAKNVWLQELPQAMTKLTWDNAAIVGPQTASRLGLAQNEIVALSHGGQRLELPVFVMPGQAFGSIAVHLGYGRVCRDEAVKSDAEVVVGTDVSPLRTLANKYVLTDVEARATSIPYKLATTQDHFSIDKRGLEVTKERAGILVREGTAEQIAEGGKDFVEALGTHHPRLESLWEEPIEKFERDETVPYQWGMTIDLNKCTGCNACVVACQAENNIPVVGKEQVSRGREMHWIRVDRYFRGSVDAPQMVNQPVACAHCETAPCEQVCPVAATVHTEEGINAMAYNRCIGTRYCANNCPYKVRRFNYFNYNTEYGYFYGWERRDEMETANRKLQQLVLNPEVTVRGRGVMEKCTYCIQRVQNGKIDARREGRRIEDGEVQSACQTACPTQAIVFGDIKDRSTRVARLQEDPRAYAMLAELNIKPRTLYLARVRNPHPRLRTVEQRKEAQEFMHGHGGHGDHHANGDGHQPGASAAPHGDSDHAGAEGTAAEH
ncbi:MAG: 4Fe-4S dicluster domain-containing protein [Planctomycetota bacterium]|nr:MAG: 4Fe-4S dicluster domain-containing protein [Planctomycetota bacterium]